MLTKEFLALTGKDYKQAAKELGVHPIYFNTIANGAKPGPKLTIDMEEWSGRLITRQELRPDLWPPEQVNPQLSESRD